MCIPGPSSPQYSIGPGYEATNINVLAVCVCVFVLVPKGGHACGPEEFTYTCKWPNTSFIVTCCTVHLVYLKFGC